ncbi:MAG: aminotransferase class I/II-fold pyridoxal phosphate-dependent enzyme, partial [Acinetobacter sp.]|nr:aminotransferase class I/II-fold pyridoxal phosphate-dependent enzyme [Acinetobacter sp.]
ALATFMAKHPEHITQLSDFYQAKRDLFNAGLKESRFQFTPSQGTYFQNLNYSAIRPDLNDIEMCQYLAEQHSIVAIPVSAFYQKTPEDLRLIRFCFAKKHDTLQQAGQILSAV